MSQNDDYLRNIGLGQAQQGGWNPYANAKQNIYQNPYAAMPATPTPQEAQRNSKMTMKINLGWLFFLAYLIGAFGTFGYYSNHSPVQNKCFLDANGVKHDCFDDTAGHTMSSIGAGLFWPIYWGGVVALNTTK